MFSFENLSAIFIDHVTEFINEITSAIDSSSGIVNVLTFRIRHWRELSVSVFINCANYVSNIKSSTVIVKKLWKIAVLGKLGLVKLLTSLVIDDISVFVESVATGGDFSASTINESILGDMVEDWVAVGIKFEIILKRVSIFVDEGALIVLFQDWFAVFVEGEVTLQFPTLFVDEMTCVSCSENCSTAFVEIKVSLNFLAVFVD